MSSNNESTQKTLAVVFILCLFCSIVVAGTAVGLRQRQQQSQQLDQQRILLQMAGLWIADMPPSKINQVFKQRLEPRLVDLLSGQFAMGNAEVFDPYQAAQQKQQSLAIAPEQDSAQIQHRANQQRIYVVKQPSGKISSLILPIYGNGLWNMMYAFIAIQADGKTVQGLNYYQHGETPGLGGEVDNPLWQQQWPGKQLFDTQGQLAIQLKKGGANATNPHAVDALSGATLTTKGVQGTLNFWLGPLGYGPFLANVQAGLLNHG
ncbi:MAG: Na(+)-translocating NADH-quinone reductase subunit C [Candidatus Symbiodolus clandestinus]